MYFSNAWKFTRHIADPRIEVGCTRLDDRPVFFVRDNGAGFEMLRADTLFTPFQRLHGDSEFEGTGIGLAIVRRVIDRHGGRIWLDSEVNRGTTVYFEMGPTAAALAVR